MNPDLVVGGLAVLAVLAFMALGLWMYYVTRKDELDSEIEAGQLKLGAAGGASTGTVCVYRLASWMGLWKPVIIYCDQTSIALLKNNSYVVCRVAAGDHVFSSSGATSQVPLSVDAGQEYFMRCGVSGIKGFCESVSREQAQAEMRPLKQAS